MMRWLFSFVVTILLLIQACKPDPPITNPPVNDPDSLYVSTPYTLKKPGLFFYNIPNVPDNPTTVEGIRLGRMLFWDPILSADSSLSCAGCHKPELAFTDQLKFSTSLSGTTKRNTPSIENLVWAKNFFWDGRKTSLEGAAEDALKDEQHFVTQDAVAKLQKRPEYVALFKKAFGRPGDITDTKVYKALGQFMRTIMTANSKYDRWKNGVEAFTPEEQNGFDIFISEKGDCFHCHFPSNSTFAGHESSGVFQNNSLDSAVVITDYKDAGLGKTTGNADDYGKFKVPSLRNLKYTAPFMHDGRYQTLEQVVNFYSDSIHKSINYSIFMKKVDVGGLHLTSKEKSDLIAFLNTLNDDSFVTDTAFTNPFK